MRNNFFQPSFVGSSGKHGKNKLKYAKSARSNGMNPRKLSKTPILGYFLRFDGRQYAKKFFQPIFISSSGKHS